MEEKFTFFWNGPLSQWAMTNEDFGYKGSPHTQFVCNGEEFCCAEQWMMACKAQLFDDMDTRKKIMSSVDPREHKTLGRQVKNFDPARWNKYAKSIVYDGNILKFSQNFKFRAALEKTAGTTLVEASPYDTIWGIGLRETDPKAQSRSTWRGTNWLGEILTRVRETLNGYDL